MIKRELTPPHLRCTIGYCNAVYELADNSLLIVGKAPSAEMLAEIKHRIASDEFAINIPKDYFSNINAAIQTDTQAPAEKSEASV